MTTPEPTPRTAAGRALLGAIQGEPKPSTRLSMILAIEAEAAPLAALDVERWVWDGHAGHLVVGHSCRFHLATRVGHYIVSTVGEYIPPKGSRTDGTGDYEGMKTVGIGRLFETYVFPASGDGYGEVDDWSEIDRLPANDHDTATANHMAMCRRYAIAAAYGQEGEP